MENTQDWQRALSSRIGAAIQRERKERDLSAAKLASRCAELGLPIHRVTITKIEGGRSSFDLGELIVIAAALGVPPVALIFPAMPDGSVEVLPGEITNSDDAAEWFAGMRPLDRNHSVVLTTAVDERWRLIRERTRARLDSASGDEAKRAHGQELVAMYDARIEELEQTISAAGGVVNPGERISPVPSLRREH